MTNYFMEFPCTVNKKIPNFFIVTLKVFILKPYFFIFLLENKNLNNFLHFMDRPSTHKKKIRKLF